MTNNNDLRTQSNFTVNNRSTYSRRLYIIWSSCSTLEENILVLKYSAISRTSQFVKNSLVTCLICCKVAWLTHGRINMAEWCFFLFFAAIRLSYWPVSGPAAELASRNVKLNYVIRRTILAFWLALSYDLLEDRFMNKWRHWHFVFGFFCNIK